MTVVYCRGCGRQELVTSDVPEKCAACGRRDWMTPIDPKRSFFLTRDDRALLRSVKIASSSSG